MGKRIKQLIFIGLVGCAIYFLLAYHIIFFGKEVEILKKENLVLDHTFYSPGDRKEIMYKGLDSIIANEDLRRAGIGELLVERGLVSEEELRRAEDKVDYGG
ncbi:MAG: hypothetical protein ACOC3W_01020 [Thermodesulfobacteriota bacterium]